MTEDSSWTGKAVSIVCDERLGIFQGVIKEISSKEITIVRAFRNGVPLRQQDAEVTLMASDIKDISLIPSFNGQNTILPSVINKPTPVKLPNFEVAGNDSMHNQQHSVNTNDANQASFPTLASFPNVKNSSAVENFGNYTLHHPQNLVDQEREQILKQQQQQAFLGLLSNGAVNKNNGGNATVASQGLDNRLNATMQDRMSNLSLIENREHRNGFVRVPSTHHNQSFQSPNMNAANNTNSIAQFFSNLIPPKVEVRLGSAFIPFNASGRKSTGSILEKNSVESNPSNEYYDGRNQKASTFQDPASYNRQSSYNQIDDAFSGGYCGRNMNGRCNNGKSRSNNNSSNANANMNGYCENNVATQVNNTNNIPSNNSEGGPGSSNNSNGNGKRQQRKPHQASRESNARQYEQYETFSSTADDPEKLGEFDFEGNLALFDKKAIWNVIELQKKKPKGSFKANGNNKLKDQASDACDLRNDQEPSRFGSDQQNDSAKDNTKAGGQKKKKHYRHDENILTGEPLEMRPIDAPFQGSTDFTTDEGLIVPTIPLFARSKIEMSCDKQGFSLIRQFENLSRGAVDIALTMLGGARRLKPSNCHQWPKVVIASERSLNSRDCTIGAVTGRLLASHGIPVVLYSEEDESIEQKCTEIALFKATNNKIAYKTTALPTNPDLVILISSSNNLSGDVRVWLKENRAPIFAIDPPASGLNNVVVKCSIFPILPVNGIQPANCGKIYLCNIGIPDKFFHDACIKYKSPFGHKFVIPIYPKD